MIKKIMLLADTDERYVKELSYFFMENVPQMELVTFTKKEKLMQYLNEKNHVDILVADEKLADLPLKELTPDTTRIAMSVSWIPIDGFELVKKYQRMENLSEIILLKYAEKNGNLEAVKGNSHTKIVTFFHPAGGTGKTTLSLALATAGAKAGYRTLYLNLEDVNSVYDVFAKTKGNLSDVFLALKTKGMNPGIKLKGSVGREPSAGFYYLSGVESISEYEEIHDEEMQMLFAAIQELADYDLVVADPNSCFAGRTKEILKNANAIFVPVTGEEGNMVKLQHLLEESQLHSVYDSLFQKMYMVVNKVREGTEKTLFIPELVCSQIPFCTSIAASGMLKTWKNIFLSDEAMLRIMEPVLQIVMEKNKAHKERIRGEENGL